MTNHNITKDCYSYDEFEKYEFVMWKYLDQQERGFNAIYARSVYKNKKIIHLCSNIGAGSFSTTWSKLSR